MAVLTVVLCMCCGCSGPVSKSGAAGDRPAGVRDGYGQYSSDAKVSPVWRKKINAGLSNAYKDGADAVNQILTDGVITADEMNILERQVVGCYARHGLQANADYWFSQGSGIDVWSTSKVKGDNPYERECEIESGYQILVYYYNAILRNPDSIDLEPYRYQCYKEHDLLTRDYSYEEFERLSAQGSATPLLKGGNSGDPATLQVSKCTDDPLHNISNATPGR
ncbi:hypothetical protein [Bifidobacterium avesanii]|uniref:Uncharacterized protein n=1 Tax=Bifidobacterium avesanii TaxID=1798157 RepID=A0A7K3TGC9_9BIFI|nr:hypothetical protein [Bifidobacterium avesanii]NEG77986.1 hypothetical protein [Bifidobacterium avesanii]